MSDDFVTDPLFGDAEPHRRQKSPPRNQGSRSRPHSKPRGEFNVLLGKHDIDPHSTSAAEVHNIISIAAAALANDDPRLTNLVDYPVNVFYPSSEGQGGGISVAYEPLLAVGRDEQWRRQMEQIVVDAARTVIQLHPDLIIGLAMGHARQGQNYFNFF